MRALVVNGPNLNLLGTREPEIYGSTTLAELDTMCAAWGTAVGFDVDTFQSNHEGAIIDRLHDARTTHHCVVINPGALTHYSYALHDAIAAIGLPTVEVHISNVERREPWRRRSVVAPACVHRIYGRGVDGYRWALSHLASRLEDPPQTISYGPEPDNVGDLRLPGGEARPPVVMLVHGGFWRDWWQRDLMDGLAVDLTRRGYATWNVEYRRLGSGGGWPHTALDIAAAADHVARLPVAGERMAIVGHSAGGHLALWAAGRGALTAGPGSDPLVTPRVAVGLAPVSDLARAEADRLGDGAAAAFLAGAADRSSVYRQASPIEMVPLGVAQVIVHGTGDDAVPVDMSDAYVAAAADAGDEVTYLRLEGVDHMSLIDPAADPWSETLTAVEAMLQA